MVLVSNGAVFCDLAVGSDVNAFGRCDDDVMHQFRVVAEGEVGLWVDVEDDADAEVDVAPSYNPGPGTLRNWTPLSTRSPGPTCPPQARIH